jgi:AcrR family transcriptional regulator
MVDERNRTRREVEIETRRALIVDTARRLLSTSEVESTSMDDIAAAVQYTRRTLYAYFRSRDEILLQVFADDTSNRWAVQREAVAGVDAAVDKLRVWGECLFDYSCDHPSSVRLQAFWSYKGIDRSKISDGLFAGFEALNNELANGLREIFRQGIEDGSFRPGLEIDLCVSQFLYSLRAVIDRALSSGYSFAQFDASEYVNRFLDLFIRGIRNHKETS